MCVTKTSRPKPYVISELIPNHLAGVSCLRAVLEPARIRPNAAPTQCFQAMAGYPYRSAVRHGPHITIQVRGRTGRRGRAGAGAGAALTGAGRLLRSWISAAAITSPVRAAPTVRDWAPAVDAPSAATAHLGRRLRTGRDRRTDRPSPPPERRARADRATHAVLHGRAVLRCRAPLQALRQTSAIDAEDSGAERDELTRAADGHQTIPDRRRLPRRRGRRLVAPPQTATWDGYFPSMANGQTVCAAVGRRPERRAALVSEGHVAAGTGGRERRSLDRAPCGRGRSGNGADRGL